MIVTCCVSNATPAVAIVHNHQVIIIQMVIAITLHYCCNIIMWTLATSMVSHRRLELVSTASASAVAIAIASHTTPDY